MIMIKINNIITNVMRILISSEIDSYNLKYIIREVII